MTDVINYKCRKCRTYLCESVPNAAECTCCHTWSDIRAIQPTEANDTYPQWMHNHISKGDWLRGKLYCPRCSSKLGAFDFVKGSRCSCRKELLPEVYLLLNKVDQLLPTQQQLATSASGDCGSGSSAARPEGTPDRGSSAAKPEGTSDRGSNAARPEGTSHHNVNNCRTDSTHDHHDKTAACEDQHHQPPVLPCMITLDSSAASSVDSPSCNDKAPVTRKPVLNIKSEHLCRICLDLLVMPRSCKPCNHIFCEYCLRLLARHAATPQYVHCPLCRDLIYYTFPQPELCVLLMLEYGGHYEVRYKQHRMLPYPLPFVSSLPQIRPMSSSAINLLLLTILCFVFFFVCFIPGVYLSSIVYDWIDNDVSWALLDQFAQDIWEIPNYFYSSGLFMSSFSAIAVAVFVYILFVH